MDPLNSLCPSAVLRLRLNVTRRCLTPELPVKLTIPRPAGYLTSADINSRPGSAAAADSRDSAETKSRRPELFWFMHGMSDMNSCRRLFGPVSRAGLHGPGPPTRPGSVTPATPARHWFSAAVGP